MAGIHHSTPWRGARAQRAGAIALGASLLLAAASGPALADKVGVAAAVNPDAFSSLSGTPNKQLNIGKSIFYNERINTTNSGLVQVLLVDGSTFTVGPNSDLLIDKFVYDPRKKTGQVVATFSKGAMRFVGGKLSKNEGGVTVNTPAGALAIRGGMFQASLSGNRGVFSFLFGNEMRLGNQRVFEPGYTIDTTSGAPTIRPTTRADINGVMAALTNSDTSGVGGTETEQPEVQPDQLADTISLQDMIADATATQINDSLEAEEKKETSTPPPTTVTNDETPKPVQVTFRVLSTPGVYTAFPGTDAEYTTDNGSSILGGGNYGNTPPGPPPHRRLHLDIQHRQWTLRRYRCRSEGRELYDSQLPDDQHEVAGPGTGRLSCEVSSGDVPERHLPGYKRQDHPRRRDA